MENIAIIVLASFSVAVGAFSYWKSRSLRSALQAREVDTQRRMYELAILKELGDRIGYSLDVQKIVDIITGSLRQFVQYSAVSYMLLEPEKIVFKMHLEQSVSRGFVDDVRQRMLDSLSALLSKEFKKEFVEETLSGAILVEELGEPVRSFFNIPLVIGDKAVGVLTVAHTKSGLYKEEEMTILYKITKQASDAVTRLHNVVKTEQAKLSAMVESIYEGIVMTDNDYRILVANPAVKKIIGFELKHDITIFDFIDTLEGKFDIRGKLEESIKLGKILTAEEVVVRDRFYQIVVSPVRGVFGIKGEEVLGGVVIFHDATKEKEVEKLREDFTHMIVHELRSPLDNIKKIVEYIKTEGSTLKRAKEKEYLSMVYKDSSEMLMLVNDLLDAAKLESGKFEIFERSTNIREIVRQRISFFSTAAQDKGISLTGKVSDGVPEETMFDPERIGQVINNLLSNSLKFTQTGGDVKLQVFLHEKAADMNSEIKQAGVEFVDVVDTKNFEKLPDSLIFAVTDSGKGIPQEFMPHLFTKFKQVYAEALTSKGTGLGLAIVKGIVEAHGGVVSVVSRVGTGSTFTFTIPCPKK